MVFKTIKEILTLTLLIVVNHVVNAQTIIDSLSLNTDTISQLNKKKALNTGIKLIPIPDFKLDPYEGFRFGAVLYVYDFGDGARYPNFYSSTKFEASYTTKGATNFKVMHKRIGKKVFYGEFIYQNQIVAPYFGVNGYQQSYNKDFMDTRSLLVQSPQNPLFYNYAVMNLAINLELQDTIRGTKHINWLMSLYSGWYDVSTIDKEKQNRGLDSSSIDFISDTATTLYELNKKWGIVDENLLEGGKFYSILKTELIYDKRDRITNPLKGILSRIGLSYLPKLSNNSYGNVLIANASHSQYIPLVKGELFKTSFAYRFKYLGYFGGVMPYAIQEGIGGIKSVWGVHKNRAMVRQWSSGQFEFRTKLFNIKRLEFWSVPFFHTGFVIQEQQLDLTKVPDEEKALFFNENYGRLYSSFGWMGKMVVKKNIALGFDLAFPINKESGPKMSMFIGLGFSFKY